MKYIYLIALYGIGAVCGYYGLFHARWNRPSCHRCNVVVLSIDPWRADRLPCSGYRYNTMPRLCSYAARSISATNAYSQSSWTLPSVMSFMTSQYPYQHGMLIPLQSTLPAETTTLPQAFRNAGYHTIYIGDTDNSHLPLDRGLGRGFDTILNNPRDISNIVQIITDAQKTNTPTFIFVHNFNLLASWRNVDTEQQFPFDPMFSAGPIKLSVPFSQSIWDNAIAFLEQDAKENPSTMLLLLKQAKTLEQAQSLYNQLPKETQNTIESFSIFDTVDAKNLTHMRLLSNIYDKKLLELDELLGPLIDSLEQPDTAGRTVVAITGNHGEEFGEHGRINHGTNIFGTTTHIPLILHIPNTPPRQLHSIIQSIDIYPTLLDIVGINPPPTAYGKSFISNIVKDDRSSTSFSISQLGPLPWISSIRTNQWSYYSASSDGDKPKLFDLTTDPNEQHNVILNHPDTANSLAHQLDKLNQTHMYSGLQYQPPEQ